jgi:hypothetical protein
MAYVSLGAAAAALQCEVQCVYVAAQAALGVRCGQKGESTTYHDGGVGQTRPAGSCEALVYADFASASGWYLASQADAFWAAHPCP